MSPKRLSTVLSALALAAAMAGCGSSGSSGVSATTYVHSFCGAVGPFARDLLARTSALDLSAIKSPGEGKQAIQGYLSAIASDTDGALAKLRAAGTPRVDHGRQISGEVVRAFTALDHAMRQAVTQSGSLPTSSTAALRAGTQQLDAGIRTSLNSISRSLQGSTFKSPDLQKALSSDPACRAIVG